MVVAFKVKTSKWVDTLKEINNYETIQKIADATGKNYHTIRYHAIILEKIRFLYSLKVANKRRYFLTKEGTRFLSKTLSRGGENFKVKWRLHANEFVFKILVKPEGWDRKKPKILITLNKQVREVSLNNNTYALLDFLPVCVKVTNNEVRFFLNDIYGSTPEEVQRESIKQLMEILPTISRYLKKLGIIIRKPQFGVDATNTSHYARENDELAVAVSKNNQTIRAIDGRGELRAISDKSKGVPEFELVHPVHSPEDAETYNNFVIKVLEGKIKPTDNVEKAVGIMAKNQEQLIANLEKVADIMAGIQYVQQKEISSSMRSSTDIGGVEKWN